MITTPSPFFDRVRIDGNPAAHPQSTFICGQARFTLLTARLIRLEWSSSGQFEDRATFAFPTRYAEPTAYSSDQHGSTYSIQTAALGLRYVDDGKPFSRNNLLIRFDLNGAPVEWTPGMVNIRNLRGTRRTLDQCADAADLQEGLLARDGWSLFDDSAAPVWNADGVWVEARHDDEHQDWYFFGYGHDYKAALADYIHFGGAIPLIPRYVLGGWWSRFWAYSAQDLLDLVNAFDEHDIPLDVLVVDMDWHTPDAWTGYTWNRQLFPDPEGFLAQVHEKGLYVTFNLHPAQGVQKHEQIYPEFAGLLGQDPAQGEAVKFRPADKAFMQQYFERLHHPMEEQGVDFWWLDWQQGESTEIKGLDPLPWLNHLHFRDSVRRGTRPMLYSRWGGLGNHRYPIGFSGDTYATWESLGFLTYFTPTAANVAYGWWSHDIGGHFWATDPELYARWVQFGAVNPCLRLHSTKDPLAERRPWAFPAPVYEAAKAAFQFRYQLLPYLYSSGRAAAQHGLSLCLPMYYEYPEAEDAYLASEQYFLGDQMFVAPVVHPADPATGLAAVDVWIPDGTWIDYTTLETYVGPQWVRLHADLTRIPMFVKAGAIVPLAPCIRRTRDFDGAHLIVNVFPGADGQFELYEDDGVSESYAQGDYETTLIRSRLLDDGRLAIQIDAAQGECVVLSEQRTIELHVRGIDQPSGVTVDDADNTHWSYDAAARDLSITLENTERCQPLEIIVSAAALRLQSQSAASGEPFVHVVDYTTFEDARQQLGALVIVPAASGAVDAQIEWELQTEGKTTLYTSALHGFSERQIITSPFADDGTLHALRWRAAVTISGKDALADFAYQSREAYPTINRWQTLIYNPEQQPRSIEDVLLSETRFRLNPALPWTRMTQTIKNTSNLRQPFGLVLLEQELERIAREPLAAWIGTSLYSRIEQELVIHVEYVGEGKCFLNGVELEPSDPVAHAEPIPMFYSWMPMTHLYYKLALKPGENSLAIFTRPDKAIGWWGVGATLLDGTGKVVLNNGGI